MTNVLIGNPVNFAGLNPTKFFPGFMGREEATLKVRLISTDNAVTMQILSQSPQVKAFLGNGSKYFMASNGVRIATSVFPEWKESKNILFLRGNSNYDDKVDVTRFISNENRDNKLELLTSALDEFTKAVKESQPKEYAGNPVDTFLSALTGVRVVTAPYCQPLGKVYIF